MERARINELGRGAFVVINMATKTIVASGDVELSPGIVAHKNLTVTISPKVENINIEEKTALGSKLFAIPHPSPTEGTNLDILLQALRQFKSSPEETIDILRELKNANLLHAHLIFTND
jgi:flagellar basal body P-ring protein FlgI